MTSETEGYLRPEWAFSPVCPNGYDYVAPWCKQRGYAGDAPSEKILPPGPCGEMVENARAVAQNAHALAGQAWMKADGLTHRTETANLAAGAALLIAFMALLVVHVRLRKQVQAMAVDAASRGWRTPWQWHRYHRPVGQLRLISRLRGASLTKN